MNNKLVIVKKIAMRFLQKALITLFYLSFIYFLLSLSRIWDMLSHEKTLNVYTFSEFLTPESIKEFEKETGVKVYVRYFETNEELLAKFRVNQGEGYDIITPSDYMVENMKKAGFLLKLEHSKLPCMQDLDPRLLNKFFDIGNEYSLPLLWFVYGLVFDKNIIKAGPSDHSLELVFNDPKKLFEKNVANNVYKICMLDDGREAIMLAATYLFGRVKNFSEADYQKIFELLLIQKKWVESYTSYGLQYSLFTGIVPVAITSSSYMRKMMQVSDKFEFKIPKQGSLLTIENLAIPAKSNKVDIAYKFINFMLSKKIASFNCSAYGHIPSNMMAYQDIDEKIRNNLNLFPTDELFSKLHLVHNEIPVKKVEEIWLGVKFAK